MVSGLQTQKINHQVSSAALTTFSKRKTRLTEHMLLQFTLCPFRTTHLSSILMRSIIFYAIVVVDGTTSPSSPTALQSNQPSWKPISQHHRRSLPDAFLNCDHYHQFNNRHKKKFPLHQPTYNERKRPPSTSTPTSDADPSQEQHLPPIRLNKVFKATHSRRQSDLLIQQGRVSVNGIRILPTTSRGGSSSSSSSDDDDNAGVGIKVMPYVDEVRLDGKIVEGWEEIHGFSRPSSSPSSSSSVGEYAVHSNPYAQFQSSKDKTTATNKDKSKNDINRNRTYQYIKYWKPRGVICTTDRSIRNNIMEQLNKDGYFPPHRVFPVGRLDKDTSGKIS